MIRTAYVTAAFVLLGALPASAQDWPMWRHDAQRTAVQTLPGLIDIPAVKWSLPLGGSLGGNQFLVDDVNLDGEPEAVLVRGGRVVARHFDGTVVWATEPLAIWWVLAATDFDRDGRPEVWAGSYWTGIFALDGTTGAVPWLPGPAPDPTGPKCQARVGSTSLIAGMISRP